MNTATARPVADLFSAVFNTKDLPFHLIGYDGSDLGREDSEVTLKVSSPNALRHVISAPGELGLARAYLTDSLQVDGIHPGNPYPLF